ncbi:MULTISPECIES: PulJ/GspJ family protein [unclassified Undibacterium]|uniref:PulJ/GspJ family protein n=1 Tax=unclassified Undibacterium TaxID=2630295 RepID=UPI002AC93553|nr:MULTISPECIES: prepilin-type N-terminal cleavage/methylation domain-containing protein [unclassified Undibacterium]MEB0138340.1 prepilin-type N-terminal cleavage/methylation domain-containing protein [Undibacterium sp. CCC2.1]MEB0172717.1 prepilin-type N-terminal cleavage/methylation domain-containing protein [Undibacterium sp. CCC1.1]MEB0174715.1 prepilin-type N-terminal cleavage/methylation domain-containing protein [Undibacterium sp. CCC3.4]MEB0213912.1 prepilin-type N-terminal cleavage/me
MLCKQQRPAFERGFTLIELLVAITILAIIAVLGWRGLDSIVRARLSLNAEMEQTRAIQLSFAQMESDCAHLADETMLLGHSVLTASGDKLSLIRSVNNENEPGQFQVVNYRVADGKLTRRELPPSREIAVILDEWQSFADDTSGQTGIELQSNVQSFALRTWRQGDNAWQINGAALTTAASKVANDVLVQAGVTTKVAKLAGLEVSLQVQGANAPMRKVFLLGAN